MKANKIEIEYIVELLESSKLTTDCSVCRNTKKQLYAIAKKEMAQKYR